MDEHARILRAIEACRHIATHLRQVRLTLDEAADSMGDQVDAEIRDVQVGMAEKMDEIVRFAYEPVASLMPESVQKACEYISVDTRRTDR